MAKEKTTQSITDQVWVEPRQLGVSERNFFKPEDGKTKRIKLMAQPVRAHVQYVKGMGFIRTLCEYEDRQGTLVMKTEGADVKILGKEPQLIWMVPVLVYDTDKKGQVGNKKPENIDYDFQLWSFYANDYKRLYGMVVEWGIDEFNEKDLLVTGKKSGKYINADFNVAAKTALYLQPGMKERVDAEFASYQYSDVERWIARVVTEDELLEAVGVDTDKLASGNIKNSMKG